MKENSRTCIGCKHFAFHLAEPGYSEVTPGLEFSMECYRSVWTFDPYTTNKVVLLTAENCPHYEFNDLLK